MIHTNFIIPFLFICKKYNIPSDISFYIHNIIINHYSKIISNYWYTHIMIHNINLSYLISNLTLYTAYDPFGHPFYYYDLYNRNVGVTFLICYKYLNLRISSLQWWKNRIYYAFNALYILNDNLNSNFNFNCNAITLFYSKLNYQLSSDNF